MTFSTSHANYCRFINNETYLRPTNKITAIVLVRLYNDRLLNNFLLQNNQDRFF
jgi:hypothetical protein